MRQSWTDDRLDDLAQRVDAGFARVDDELKGVRGEIAEQGKGLRGEIRGLGAELRQEMGVRFDAVDRRFEALEARFDRFQATIVGGFVSILVALIALHFS